MMYMMITDIAGKPVKDPWQFVIRTPLHCSNHIIPILFSALKDMFVLMLNIKKPQRIRTKEEQVGKLNDQESFGTEKKGKNGIDRYE